MTEKNELTSNTATVFGRVPQKIVKTIDENEDFLPKNGARFGTGIREKCVCVCMRQNAMIMDVNKSISGGFFVIRLCPMELLGNSLSLSHGLIAYMNNLLWSGSTIHTFSFSVILSFFNLFATLSHFLSREMDFSLSFYLCLQRYTQILLPLVRLSSSPFIILSKSLKIPFVRMRFSGISICPKLEANSPMNEQKKRATRRQICCVFGLGWCGVKKALYLNND